MEAINVSIIREHSTSQGRKPHCMQADSMWIGMMMKKMKGMDSGFI